MLTTLYIALIVLLVLVAYLAKELFLFLGNLFPGLA